MKILQPDYKKKKSESLFLHLSALLMVVVVVVVVVGGGGGGGGESGGAVPLTWSGLFWCGLPGTEGRWKFSPILMLTGCNTWFDQECKMAKKRFKKIAKQLQASK